MPPVSPAAAAAAAAPLSPPPLSPASHNPHQVFQWARDAGASQPLTSGPWKFDLRHLKCVLRAA